MILIRFLFIMNTSTDASSPSHSDSIPSTATRVESAMPSHASEAMSTLTPQGEDMEVDDTNESAPPPAAPLPTFKKVKSNITIAERIAEAKILLQRLGDEREQHHLMLLQVTSDAILQGATSLTPEDRKSTR